MSDTPDLARQKLIARLRKMVATPNLSFHYREDCEAVRQAIDALAAEAQASALQAQVNGLREGTKCLAADISQQVAVTRLYLIGNRIEPHFADVLLSHYIDFARRAQTLAQPPADEAALGQALADHERTMREEVIPRINADLRQQALMAERLRRGLPPADEAAKGEG